VGGATISSSGAVSWTPSTIGTYSIKVRATDNASPILYDEEIATVNVTGALVAGIAAEGDEPVESTESLPLNGISRSVLFPNPAKEKFSITLEKASLRAEFRIIDIKGMLLSNVAIKRVSGSQFQLTVANLRPGNYIVRIQTDNGEETLPFVRN